MQIIAFLWSARLARRVVFVQRLIYVYLLNRLPSTHPPMPMREQNTRKRTWKCFYGRYQSHAFATVPGEKRGCEFRKRRRCSCKCFSRNEFIHLPHIGAPYYILKHRGYLYILDARFLALFAADDDNQRRHHSDNLLFERKIEPLGEKKEQSNGFTSSHLKY
jgi:hypothetical protein